VVREDGKVGWDIRAFTERGVERGKEEAVRRGAKTFKEEGLGKDFAFQPYSRGGWEFTIDERAFRTATKVALVGLAANGRALARSEAFRPAARYVRYGDGGPLAALFFNRDFASRIHSGPHQHAIYYCYDYSARTLHAIVVFFGAIFYLVRLSDNIQILDYGFSHIEDTLTKQRTSAIVSRLENECEAIRDVLTSKKTAKNDLMASLQYYVQFIGQFVSEGSLWMEQRVLPNDET
jgi:hypothetical protein